jgi:hypothetical protein
MDDFFILSNNNIKTEKLRNNLLNNWMTSENKTSVLKKKLKRGTEYCDLCEWREIYGGNAAKILHGIYETQGNNIRYQSEDMRE